METSWGEVAAIFVDCPEGMRSIGGLEDWRSIVQKDKGITNIHASGYWLFEKPPEVVWLQFYTREKGKLIRLWLEKVRMKWPESFILDGKLHEVFIEGVPA